MAGLDFVWNSTYYSNSNGFAWRAVWLRARSTCTVTMMYITHDALHNLFINAHKHRILLAMPPMRLVRCRYTAAGSGSSANFVIRNTLKCLCTMFALKLIDTSSSRLLSPFSAPLRLTASYTAIFPIPRRK